MKPFKENVGQRRFFLYYFENQTGEYVKYMDVLTFNNKIIYDKFQDDLYTSVNDRDILQIKTLIADQ